MTIANRVLGALILSAAVAGCAGVDEQAVPTAIEQQRTNAYRQACAAKEIEQTAEENLAVLESSVFDGADDALAATRDAAVGFSRGYHRHAELRHALYAMVDSAVNHATTTTDSIRYEERANAFTVRVPAAGTVEANAMERYEVDLRAILGDADHPCNWNIPGRTEPA